MAAADEATQAVTGRVPSRPVLSVSGVTRSFRHGVGPGRRTAKVLRGVDMVVDRGELIGLVGENGSGKSTLLKIIVGMLERDGGSVERSGSLGYCPQLPWLGRSSPSASISISSLVPTGLRKWSSTARPSDSCRSCSSSAISTTGSRSCRVDAAEAQPVARTDARSRSAAARRALRRIRLGDIHALLGVSAGLRDGGMAIVIVSHLISERDRLDRIYELRDGRLEGR